MRYGSFGQISPPMWYANFQVGRWSCYAIQMPTLDLVLLRLFLRGELNQRTWLERFSMTGCCKTLFGYHPHGKIYTRETTTLMSPQLGIISTAWISWDSPTIGLWTLWPLRLSTLLMVAFPDATICQSFALCRLQFQFARNQLETSANQGGLIGWLLQTTFDYTLRALQTFRDSVGTLTFTNTRPHLPSMPWNILSLWSLRSKEPGECHPMRLSLLLWLSVDPLHWSPLVWIQCDILTGHRSSRSMTLLPGRKSRLHRSCAMLS